MAIRYFLIATCVPPLLRCYATSSSGCRGTRTNTSPSRSASQKFGGALLTLKEIEYFGAAQPGEFQDRLDRLIDRLLMPLAAEWLQGPREKDIVQRVKLLRIAMLPGMAAGTLAKSELHRPWRQLAGSYLAQQLAFYPPGYLAAHPTPERLLETVERFEEDLTDVARIHTPMRAVVAVGEAIDVSPEHTRCPDGDPLMTAIREQLEKMLAASSARSPDHERVRPPRNAHRFRRRRNCAVVLDATPRERESADEERYRRALA